MKKNDINFTETDLVRSICKESYYEFFNIAWDVLEPTTKLIPNWHIKYLCDLLQGEVERIAEGNPKDRDIIINVPPRSLKSSITTVYLNAWAWIKYPHLKFISASYSEKLAIQHSVATRRLIESNWYKQHFGYSFKLTSDQNLKSWFENDKTGMRKAVGVGSGITGSGSDIIIADDPINPDLAMSEVERRNCIEWYNQTLYSRLNQQAIGLKLVIMQRLHQQDLVGFLLENQKDYYKLVCLPIEKTDDIEPNELSANYENGLLFSKRYPDESLVKWKKALGEYGYAGQMLQRPSPLGGGMVKQSWWKYYTEVPKIKRTVWSWDTAVKTDNRNDYSVGILKAECNNGFYILDMIRGKWEYPDLKRMIQSAYNKYNSNTILVEDKSSGQQIIQDLKRDSILPIVNFKFDKDKITRVGMVSSLIESGRVFLKDNAGWLVDFLNEFNSFPHGANDDIVDSETQALLYLSRKKPLVYGFA